MRNIQQFWQWNIKSNPHGDFTLRKLLSNMKYITKFFVGARCKFCGVRIFTALFWAVFGCVFGLLETVCVSSFLYAQLILGNCRFRHFLWSFVRISVIFTFVWSPSWWHPRLGCHDPTDSFPLHFRNQNVISCLNRRQFFAPTRSALILHHGRVSSTNIASKLFSLRMKTLLHFLLLFRGLSQAVVG